jgi:OHCU decarboxylase
MTRFAEPPASLTREAFLARYAGVWEDSPWIAEAAFDRGLGPETATPEGLAEAMAREVDAASDAARLALLRAHPDLAGRLALAGGLTEASTREQAGAGLDACTPEELAEFQALNDRYVARFGFPFILAVKGYHRTDILNLFRRRAENDPEAERAEAIAQVKRIARLRLDALAADGA